MKHDIRTGDVWRSDKGGRDVTVEPPIMFANGAPRGVSFRGKTGAVMHALTENFLRGRTLIERGGVRVGDVRSMGKASALRVLSIAGDNAGCDDHPTEGGGTVLIPLEFVAAMPLITRDGKAVT